MKMKLIVKLTCQRKIKKMKQEKKRLKQKITFNIDFDDISKNSS